MGPDETPDRSFLNFVENSVVHERNSDTWEFGKGALSVKLYGVTVLRGAAVGKGKESRRLEV